MDGKPKSTVWLFALKMVNVYGQIDIPQHLLWDPILCWEFLQNYIDVHIYTNIFKVVGIKQEFAWPRSPN